MYFARNFINNNYVFIYNNTIKYLILRHLNTEFNLNDLKIELYFKFTSLYKLELLSIEMINHLTLMKYLFPKCIFNVKGLRSRFIRGIYYYRFHYKSFINEEKEKLAFLNFLVNIFFKLIKPDNIEVIIMNNSIIIVLKDLSYFANLKMGSAFYLNNVEDRLYIRFIYKNIESLNFLKNILMIFKIDY